jgi:hypothetical protein
MKTYWGSGSIAPRILDLGAAYLKLYTTLFKPVIKPNTEKVAGGWRRLHKEDFQNLYASPHIIMVIKSRRM